MILLLAAALHISRAEWFFCEYHTRETLSQCVRRLPHWACHEALIRRWPSDDGRAKAHMAAIRKAHPCGR
jgi:hypothetical protein